MHGSHSSPRHAGHTIMELIVAMVASTMLLAGLGSVMLIARQVAYTPTGATRRIDTDAVVNQLADELRYATLIIQQTPTVLEFIVADRDANGIAEKFRYEWSGTLGDPLYKTVNGGTPVVVLNLVNAFQVSCLLKSSTTSYTTTNDSAEVVLQSNATVQTGSEYPVNTLAYDSQQINPAAFPSIPANAISWNATKVDYYGRNSGTTTDTLLVQLRRAGDPKDGPTSHVLGQASIAESAITSTSGWNTATFSSPIRDLLLNRRYVIAWAGLGGGNACRLLYNDSNSSGVLESDNGGSSWSFQDNRQLFYRLYGKYTTPGTTYSVNRDLVSSIRILLQSGNKSHSRIDTSVPLANLPELLTAYWRTDFDSNPTTTNANGDAVSDWGLAAGTFDTATLIGGVWYATAALETRPHNDFTKVTTVDVRCRNTTVGGNGAVLRINADRQGGTYAPILVYLQLQADGTQTLTLNGKSSDGATVKLFSRQRLPSGFVRFKLAILPQNNVVNLQINGEDQGTYTYSLYAPTTSNDRFLTMFANTSLAEFDYADVRVGTN